MPINVFGGGPVQTADVSYNKYDINSSNSPFQLNWPSSYKDTSQLVTKIIDVNAIAQNLIVSANLASTTNLVATYVNGTSGVGATLTMTAQGPLTIDGSVTALNDRILVAGQTNAAQNGIYTVTHVGTLVPLMTPTILTRSLDYDTPDEISQGDYINITEGFNFINTSWAQTAPGPFVIGTTAITWIEGGILQVILPKANEVSVGMSFIIRNIGNSDFNLLDNTGISIGSIKVNLQYYYYLTDNSTVSGIWKNVVFGAGTSSADAANLAGNGLVALTGRLNTNIAVTPISTSPYTITTADRANLLVWTTGSGIVQLPATNVLLPSGFYFSFNNEGTGIATITPPVTTPPTLPVTIDGNTAGLAINPGQSLSCIYDGTNWFSLGLGQQTSSLFRVLPLDVSLGGSILLNKDQASNSIQIYTGILTANVIITFPVGSINQWTIYNKTTGAFTLTVKYADTLIPIPITGNSYIIPQGGEQVFFSDGTNLYQAINYVSLVNGTTALPSLNFLGGSTSSSGFHSDNTGAIILANTNPTTSISLDLINFGTQFGIKFLQPGAKLDLASATNTTGNQILLNNGTAALPSLNFLGTVTSGDASSSGFYSGALGNIILANTFTPSIGPAVVSDFIRFDSGITLLTLGSTASPSLKFLTGQTATAGSGFYSDNIGNLLLTNKNASGASLDLIRFNAGITFLTSGTASAPSLKFLNSGLDGIYSTTAGHISVAAAGSLVADFNTTGINISQPIVPDAGIKATSFHNQSPTTTTGDMIYYNGTTDVRLPIGTKVGQPLVTGASSIPGFAGLSIMQIQTFHLTAASAALSNTTMTPTTTTGDIGLTVNITPTATNNQIFVMVDISCATDQPSAATPTLAFQLVRGATAGLPGSGISINPSGAVHPNAATAVFQSIPLFTPGIGGGTLTSNAAGKICFNFLDNPGTTLQMTYKVQAALVAASGTYFINRPGSISTPVVTSTITVIEVAGF